ncbi:MAG: cardiolipin synthase [Spirochaetales bacterium]
MVSIEGLIVSFWPLLTAVATIALSVFTAGHAILYKRDSRAAVAWVGLIWLAPVVGSLLYLLLGINRVKRRALVRRSDETARVRPMETWSCTPEELRERLPSHSEHLIEMARLTARLTGLPLTYGNNVEPLFDGEQAYPAMLEAIERARKSISLATYIFARDAIGLRFVEALGRAVRRGVHVRVLVDAVGARYSKGSLIGSLRHEGVRSAAFMSGVFLWRMPYFNLRNHRKIMVVDGAHGFTGGMNIREHHLVENNPLHPTHDVHFRVNGPVVEQLQTTFAEDWYFTTGERLDGDRWFPGFDHAQADVLARVIPDGPDQDLDKMSMAFHGAMSVARRSVRIVTPYFLPERSLIAAINTCVIRGVNVDIVLPAQNNLKMVAWASTAQIWQVLEWGCRVWLSPPPFDHSKLMVIDGAYSLIGSSNWDPRSLRLNFELGLESFNVDLAMELERVIDEKIDVSHPLTKREVDGRTLPVKLRDGLMRLFAPYL